ncbi:MAG: hypothetical protein ACOC3V_01775 [bacterium]
MYNVNKNIDSETNATNFIDVGIHENVELDRVEYDVSPKGNKFLAFYFKKDGKELSHTEWEPVDNDNKKLNDKINNQMKRVKHIATKFISEEEFEFNASDFEDFSNKVIEKLKGKYEGKKVRIKVVYNYNNYTSFPNYVPFIESMDIPKENSKLEISSIDKMTKDRPDTETTITDNPFNENKEEIHEDSENDLDAVFGKEEDNSVSTI